MPCFPLGLLSLQEETILETPPEPAPCLDQMLAFCNLAQPFTHGHRVVSANMAFPEPQIPHLSVRWRLLLCSSQGPSNSEISRSVGASLPGFKTMAA